MSVFIVQTPVQRITTKNKVTAAHKNEIYEKEAKDKGKGHDEYKYRPFTLKFV